MAGFFNKLFQPPAPQELSEEDKSRAVDIAEKVKTASQYLKLEERIDRKMEQAHNADTDRTIAKHEHEADVFGLALKIAGERIIGYWVNEEGRVYKTEEDAQKHIKNPEEDEVCPASLQDVAYQ